MKIFNQIELGKRDLENEYNSLQEKYSDSEWLKIFPESKVYLRQRFSWLKKQHKDLSSEILVNLTKIYSKNWGDDFSEWFNEEIVRVFWGEDLEKLKHEIQKLKFLLNSPNVIKERITPQMIEKAKTIPFDSLIEFNRAGFAICPFHNEKSPSLHLNKKNNRIYCFGCSYSADTIKFVMDYHGLSFSEAIKRLN